jgi:hypothetical protein
MKNSVKVLPFLVVAGLCFVINCLASEDHSSRAALTLNEVETVKPGHTTKSEVEKIFGTPDKEYVESGKDGRVAWLYFEPPFYAVPRVSLLYVANSDVVYSITWQPRGGEPEYDLVKAKNRFKSAQFKYREGEWITPHASPNEAIYEDMRSGVSIQFKETTKRVESISWIDPRALLAARVPNSATKRVKTPTKHGISEQ